MQMLYSGIYSNRTSCDLCIKDLDNIWIYCSESLDLKSIYGMDRIRKSRDLRMMVGKHLLEEITADRYARYLKAKQNLDRAKYPSLGIKPNDTIRFISVKR